MGTADMVTKEYMRENAVFADAFNYLIYNGKKVIDPAKLKEIDPTEIALPFGDEEKAGEDKKGKVQETEWSSVKNGSVRKKTAGRAGKKTDAVQKYRDILKSAVIKQDEKMSYVLLGIENQTDVHYAMPVRNAIYDALQYGRQVADIAAEHRRNKKDFTGKSNGEYLSGFLKEDQVYCEIGGSVMNGSDIVRQAAMTKPKTAFFSYGTNDLGMYSGNAEAFTEKYSSVIKTFMEISPDTEIYVNSIAKPSDAKIASGGYFYKWEEFNEAIKDMCDSLGIEYIDNTEILKEHADLYAGDGIHVSTTYYPYWMDNMIRKGKLLSS